jgi:hypothetical protein
MKISQEWASRGGEISSSTAVGKYIVDFVNLENKVVIEVDGSMQIIQAIRYGMNGLGLKGIKY